MVAIPDLHKIFAYDRLAPEKFAADIGRHGGHGCYLTGIDEIVEKVKDTGRPGDVIAVLTNGGFGGIHQKLLDALNHEVAD
ncbi:MAG: hypothetical protein WCO57_14580 [Verrucomicrobiota bacterium]